MKTRLANFLPSRTPRMLAAGRYPPGRMDWLPPGRKICKVKEETNRYWCQGWLKELAQSELLKVKATLDKTDTCIPSCQSSFWLCILTTKEKSVSYEKPRPTGKSYLKVTERLSRKKKKIHKNCQIIRGLREDKVQAGMGAQLLQSCPTLSDPMDCSPPGSSSMEFFRQEHCSGLPCSPPGDLPNPGIEPVSVSCIFWRLIYPLSHWKAHRYSINGIWTGCSKKKSIERAKKDLEIKNITEVKDLMEKLEDSVEEIYWKAGRK